MINGRYEETFEEGQVEEKCAGERAEFLGVAGGCYFLVEQGGLNGTEDAAGQWTFTYVSTNITEPSRVNEKISMRPQKVGRLRYDALLLKA